MIFALQMGVGIGRALLVDNLGGSVKTENVQTLALFIKWTIGNTVNGHYRGQRSYGVKQIFIY